MVIPALAWDPYLERTLATITAQVLPAGIEIETIVALAGETPRSTPAGVRVLANPSGTIPDALNRAIGASTGEVVIRADARCLLGPDHVVRVLARLAEPSIGCVGGAQLVLDRGVFGSAYSVAFNSPLLGPSVYRYRRTSGPVDTAYLGAWRRVDLAEIGGFDPRLLRNQDNELADRVRASGKTVWYEADLVVGYFNNRTMRATMAHHREFGNWRMVQRVHGQRALTRRHLASLSAVAAVGLLTTGAVWSHRGRRIFAIVASVGYVSAACGAASTATRLRRVRSDIGGPELHPLGIALAPAVAVLMDGAWLVGLAVGSRTHRGHSRPLGKTTDIA